MKTINTTTNTTDILSLKDFCDLTRKACQLKFFPTDTIVSNHHGWIKLAELWEALIDETDVDIFRDAAYFIKWCIPAEGPSPAYQHLVEAVSNALLHDGPAREAWLNYEHCYSVILETVDEFNPWITGGATYSFSDWHHHYISYKMLLRILNYRKGHITKCKKLATFVRYYEGRIIKLLPHAANWSAEYWLNENHIIDELNDVCPYDYRNDLPSYNALLSLTSSPKRMPNPNDCDIIQYVSNVKKLAPCWAKAIWPAKTDAIIVQYLLLAEQRVAESLTKPWLCYSIGLYDPIPGVDYTLLSRSWVVSYVNSLLLSGELPTDTAGDVKRALFNIAIKS